MISNIFYEAFQTSSLWMVFLIIINLILCIYPILGAMFWFFGALSYVLFRQKEELPPKAELTTEPFITIMIPAHNEEIVIKSTLEYLLTQLNYHNYEVLVMDDGSDDRTPEILHSMQTKYSRLRVIRIEQNQGKAHAFNIGLFFAKGEYILSNDADTIPETDALIKYMQYFTSANGINYAAITANMDVYNRSSLWGKSQTVEFSSIVGIIKRSQTAINNTMYAYSGANTMSGYAPERYREKPAAICTAGQTSSENVIPYTLQHWKISGSRRNRFLLISMTALKPISKMSR